MDAMGPLGEKTELTDTLHIHAQSPQCQHQVLATKHTFWREISFETFLDVHAQWSSKTCNIASVSYTHLTLPTIYSV